MWFLLLVADLSHVLRQNSLKLKFPSLPAFRKKAHNPPRPMKPLYWTRILAAPTISPLPSPIPTTPSPTDEPDTLPTTSDSPSTPTTTTQPPLPVTAPPVLWQQIDEAPLDDLTEFTELFARRAVVPIKPKEETEKKTKVQTVKVLDGKRSQSVGIFARSIHVDFSEIENAIYHCDTSVVSLEQLTQMMAMKANDEELAQIREAALMGAPLDPPEEFLLRIANCSYSAERISCIVFQAEFDEKCTAIMRKVETLTQLCQFLMKSEPLRDLLSIILTMGNYMNGGNHQRGQADGFGLEILGKLKDVKSSDSRTTLLHFLVKTYIGECRKRGIILQDIQLPIPHPADVIQSMGVDFPELQTQLRELVAKLKGKSVQVVCKEVL